MANKKFSEFTLKTDSANVDFVVGYDGSDNVRIAPDNLGGSNPAGSDAQLQYNNGGAFGAIPGFTYNDTNDRLIIDTTRVVLGNASGTSFSNGLTVWDTTEFRNKVEFSDGSESAPSITFFNSGDDNTGIFRPASDIIAFATGGQEEFRIGANGEIGLSGANFGTSGQVLTSNGTGTGATWTTIGGGGASDLNGLSDVLIDGTSNYFVNIPAGLSGNPADNLIIGSNTGTDLTTGSKNVIIGKDAGENLLAGTENTILGVDAGTALTNGARNTFLGSSAGFFTNNSIVDVIAIGYKAGTYAAASTAIAIGREAGRNNSGNGRIDVGYKAGYSNSSGSWNLNIGYFAAYSNTTGIENTVIGTEAGYNNTGGSNTFLGYQAGYNQTTGSNNTVIGHDAEPSAVDATNEITLGDANIATLRCQVQTISALSDSRDKTNIQPSTYGLDLISQLHPVTFDWNMRDGAKVGQKDLGFIAQELQEVDDENLQLVYDNNPDRLEASYGRLIPVLVQAIKELKAEVELLKA